MVPGRKRWTLANQAWVLRGRYPHEQPPVLRRGTLRWTVHLQPTPLSVTYAVRLLYRENHPPRVTVGDPPLQRRVDAGLPHVFDHDELCLYYDEFNGGRDLIADTIVPWASEWLFHYELWVATGEWLGGGRQH